jgi:hypothetical protein
MNETTGSPEQLARRFFNLVEDRNQAALARFLHPDVSFSALTVPGDFTGRDDVMSRFYGTVFAWPLYDVYANNFRRVSDDIVTARGRLRWMNDGQLRDAPAAWTLRFKDGQLYRLSSSTRTATGSETTGNP